MSGDCTQESLIFWSKLLLESVSVPVFGYLGLFGNILVILMLKHPIMKTTFNQSLMALAVCDILFLTMMIIDQIVDKTNLLYVILFPYFWNPVKNILMSWDTFLLMSIATERFLAFRKPVVYKSQKLSYSKRTHLIIYLLPSIIFAILINIPKFLETKIVAINMTNEENTTREVMDFDITNLRLDQDYVFYYINWTRLIFTGVIPFIYLIVMNILIVLAIKKKIPSGRKSKNSCNFILQQESKLPKVKLPRQSALTLVAINVLFLICNFPRLFLNIAEWNIQLGSVINGDEFKQVPNWFDFLMSLSNFSLTINSAANCLIYFYFSKKFKNELQMNIQWAKAWAWGFIITSSSHVWSVLTYSLNYWLR
jgi:hypothetical protein